MDPEYKAAKEASVSLLGGGGMWEINFVTSVAPVRSTAFNIQHPRMQTDFPLRLQSSYGPSSKPARASSPPTPCRQP